MDDTNLVERFKEHNDQRAFEAIINKYETQIYRFGFRMCGQAQDAEDVVQDTFVSAYRYLKGFRGDASLLTWLLKIASSACLKKRRLKKDEPRRHVSLDDMQESGTADSVAKTDDDASPVSLVISHEVRRRLQEVLAEIPEHYRVVLVLRDLEGLSTKEVSETLEITESAAKVRLHRARAMLYKLLAEVYDVSDEHETAK